MVITRNLELLLPIENAEKASRLDIPTRPDQNEPIFELAIEFWPRKPKFVPRALPYDENEPQWLNSFFLVLKWLNSSFFWASHFLFYLQ